MKAIYAILGALALFNLSVSISTGSTAYTAVNAALLVYWIVRYRFHTNKEST